MAITPIQLFQNDQQSSISQILQGGNMSVQHIIDNAIQLGRDMSNKQLAQERDMFAMRQQETALAQRRSEDLQQNNEDAQRFAQNAYQFDTKFGADQQQQQVQNERIGAQQIFSNDLAAQRMDLAENADTRAEKVLGLKEQEIKKQQDFNAEILNSTSSDTQQSESTGFWGGIKKLFGGDTAPTASNRASIYTQISSARDKQAAAKSAGNADAYKAAQAEEARARAALDASRATKSGSRDELTPYQKETLALREKSAQTTQQTVDEKKLYSDANNITLDAEAFPLHVTDTSGMSPEKKAAVEASDAAWNANRGRAEVTAAQNYKTAEEFVNAGPSTLSEAQKAKRRRIWEMANQKSSTTPSGASGAVSKLGI